MKTEIRTNQSTKVLVRVCHGCGEVIESPEEPKRCLSCSKSFLPLNYFQKVHANNSDEYRRMFVKGDELHEDELIKGLLVLW